MRLPGLRVDLRFVSNPQGNGVDSARDGELVHGHLKPKHPGAPAGRPHPGRNGNVENHGAIRRPTLRSGVHHARRPVGSLGELLRFGALLEHIDGHCGECAIQLGPEPHVLDGRWTVTAEGEHLLPGQGHLHGATGQFACRHRREDGLRVNLDL